jgi:Zn-dependent protease/CBS domain-containing protein
LIIVLISASTAQQWHKAYPDWGLGIAYIAAISMALLFFASVLLHELGHSLVAIAQGNKVSSITLFLFGGIASIERESKTPGKAFQVAIAGPMVSILLAVLLGGVTLFVGNRNSPVYVIAENLALTNLVLAIFNLLPGLPLDGGQVLKSIVWKITGSRMKGVRWASKSGRFVGWMIIAYAIAIGLRTSNPFNSLFLGFIGWFIVQNASTYDRMTEIQEALLALKAGDAMTREFRVVDAKMTLRRFADDYLLGKTNPEVFFASSDGRYRGLVADETLNTVERSEWETSDLFRIIQPLDDIPTAEETSPLARVIQRMENDEMRRMTVLSPAGAVAGVIDRGDIVRALAEKLRVPVADAIIKQIKEEGAYPSGFPLGEIAQSAMESSEK